VTFFNFWFRFIVEGTISLWNIKYPHSFSNLLIFLIIICSYSMSPSIAYLSNVIVSVWIMQLSLCNCEGIIKSNFEIELHFILTLISSETLTKVI
jgi:hypothetical protein